MTNKQLFNGINNADDKFIIEALEDEAYLYSDVEKKSRLSGVFKVALPCAACAAVLFAGITFIGNRAGGFAPLSANETSDSTELSDITEVSDSTTINIEEHTGETIKLPEHKNSDFAEKEKKFSESFVSPGIVYGEPLALPEIDPATFWEGDLPVMPLKNCTNSWFEGTGNKFSLNLELPSGYCTQTALDAMRGEAVYAVADGEVTFVGVPGSPVSRDLTVIIKHNDGLYTSYDTLDEDCGILVNVGDKVTAGQVIGYAGINFSYGYGTKSSLGFGVYSYDPLDHLTPRTEYFEEWLSGGLVKPLDNVGNDFEFDYSSTVVSRNEKIIPAPHGAPVYAVSDGKVIEAEYHDSSFGLIITIEHETGIETTYYHLDSDFPHVEWGDTVKAGDVIGHIANSSFNGVSGLGYFAFDYAWVRDVPECPQ